MEQNPNTPPSQSQNLDGALSLDANLHEFPTMDSPQGGLVNLLQSSHILQQALFQQHFQQNYFQQPAFVQTTTFSTTIGPFFSRRST